MCKWCMYEWRHREPTVLLVICAAVDFSYVITRKVGFWTYAFIFTALQAFDINATVSLVRPLAQQLNKRSVLRFRIPAEKLLLQRRWSDFKYLFLKMWLLIILVLLVVWAGGTYWYLFGKGSPFSLESVRPPGPREFDQKKRDKVIKQGKAH